jgi:hypothetical protein
MARASHLTYQGIGVNLADEASCNHHPCFLSADLRSINTSLYPINEPELPADPDENSFEIFLRLFMQTAPDNKCENYGWFGPPTRPALSGGEPNAELTVYCGTTTSDSHTPTDSNSTVATAVQHTSNYSVGTALAIACETGDGWLDAYGEMTWWLCLQLRVRNGAGQGDLETWIHWWKWEES